MKRDELIARLERIRRRARGVAAGEGAARVLIGAIGVFVALAVLDWWVNLPAVLRALLSFGAVWSAVVAVSRQVIRPLRQPIPLQEVALSVDCEYSALGERLSTAIERHDHPTVEINLLWQRVEQQALNAADGLPWRDVLRSRRLLRAACAAMVTLGLFAGASEFWPALLSVGLPRYAWPLGMARWPRRVEIFPLTSQIVAASGEPITVSLRITRGAKRDMRAWVVWKEADKPARRELMVPAGESEFSLTYAAVRSDMLYWFEAGDDDTRAAPGSVRVLQRPLVERVTALVAPPEYAATLGHSTHALLEGKAAVLRYSRVMLSVAVSKAVGRADDGSPGIRLASAGGAVPRLVAADDSGLRFTGEFELDRPIAWNLTLTDAEGMSPRAPTTLRIDAADDAPPTVAITRPAHALEVTPTSQIDLAVSAEDDIDLTAVTLSARVPDGSSLPAMPLFKGSARRHDAPATQSPEIHTTGDPRGRVRLDILQRWSLAELKLAPGSLVEYWGEANDNYQHAGETHPPARSAVMRLRVISPGDFAERVREESAALAKRLRQLATDQEALRQETAKSAASGETRAAASAPVVDSLRGRQRGLASAATELAERFRLLAARVQQNRYDDGSAERQSQAAAKEISDVSRGPMAAAVAALSRAEDAGVGDSGKPKASPDMARREAGDAQATAVERLRRLLSGLEQWGDLDSVVQKTRDVLDRQEELTRQSAAVTGDLAGRELASLSPQERARLSEMANRESGLSRELAEMLARMAKLSRELSGSDRAAADALARARESIERDAAGQRMREAAEALMQNQGNRAAEAQGDAERGLRSMLAALNERNERKLAELSKQLADVSERLDRLIRAQEDLLRRTQSTQKQADAATAVPALASRQTTLQRTATELSERIEKSLKESRPNHSKEPSPVALVESAATAMNEASAKLTSADGESAMVRQVAAVDGLNAAKAALDAAQDNADRELAAKSLEEIKAALQKIRASESALLDATVQIEQRQGESGRLARRDGIRLNKLAEEQAALGVELDAARQRMVNSIAFDYVARHSKARMDAATASLKSHKAAEAVADQRAALDGLGRLLDSLEEPAPPKENKFAEEDSGQTGGGMAQGAKRERPIPALAELKLVRMLQAELNEAVKKFDARAAVPDARTEPELHEAETMGKRQGELRDLAERIIGKTPKKGDGSH